MPHRTTYFFPRQFPERSGIHASSSKQALHHEKKKVSKDAFNIGNDRRKSSSKDQYSKSSFPVGKNISKTTTIITTIPTTITTPLSDLFTSSDDEKYHPKTKQFGEDDKYKRKKKQLAAFFDWLSEKKVEKSTSHVKLQRLSTEEDRHLLVTPEPEPEPEPVLPVPQIIKERDVDRKVSLPRLSSGSSYSGSLFSGITTLYGNFTTDIKVDTSMTVHLPTIKQDVAEGKEDQEKKENLALKTKESYYLQLNLAKRLSAQAGIASELVLLQEGVPEASDAQTVSYRLWVSGCLSYSDKISDGFYNILGMNPYLWVMCNEDEEVSKLPPLKSLKEIEPSETSLEVVLVDRRGDSRLKELEDKAQELYCASENTLVLVEQLGKLVAIYMGGTFSGEQGDLHKRWKVVSRRLRDFHNCIVLPIGSLSMGLCRHRAILFKKLADYIGLPCRIARGCKYCVADHQSSCLVKIQDDRLFSREYVVDLVGQPGNVHGPDSTINGGFLSSMPSPFQIPHLNESQQPYMDDATYEILDSKHSCTFPENPPCSGNKEEEKLIEDDGWFQNLKVSTYVSVDQVYPGNESSLMPLDLKRNAEAPATAGRSIHECSTLKAEPIIMQQTYKKEMVVFGNSVINSVVKQTKVNLSSQSGMEEVESRVDNQGIPSSVTIPRYLNLEPSLAMDWLEISWEELHIKERVGAGSFGTVHRAEWHGSDVAVKVLTVQDFHDDQLREFLREFLLGGNNETSSPSECGSLHGCCHKASSTINRDRISAKGQSIPPHTQASCR
ncbi:uncharacterized protein LOC133694077 isoform X3 [Populus nigra]|uniref:uncharacterized protein LOC133694077 isoform X3 n=1 Tax=Populus nigra TaxID=3691 RepID=UPI002B2710C6|nr:uncharacterized protein LOC133694077 isoform X3 [Populus nigra]